MKAETRSTVIGAALCALSVFIFATSVAAQALPAAVQACSALKDDVQRLQCYDREVLKLSEGKSQSPPNAPASIAAPSTLPQTLPQPSQESRFGYRGNLAREELDKKAAEEPAEIKGTITSLATRPRGEYVVTLDNGQVWNQKSVSTSIDLKVGDQITLKRGALGSIWLITPNGRSTQVTRTR